MLGKRLLVFALWGVFLWPCGARAEESPIKVVASFSILGDIVRNVGGDKVAVTTLVGPDGDSHLYEPTPRDVRAVAAARLVVINGLGLEGWIPRLVDAAGFRGKLVTASNGFTLLRERGDRTWKPISTLDPHAWQDLANGQIYVANIATALAEVDPANAEAYRNNADAYRRELAALDERVRSELAAIPPAKRRVITTHDAFRYYGKAYGVEFLAPIGITTDSEPSADGIARLIRQIKREGIKALFLENVSNPRLISQLAQEAGVEVGPPLYSDALSKPEGPAGSYIKMFEYNTATLKAGMLKN